MRRSLALILISLVLVVFVVLVVVNASNERAAAQTDAELRSRLIAYCATYQVRNNLPADTGVCRSQAWRSGFEPAIRLCHDSSHGDDDAFYNCLQRAGVHPRSP
jgi:hypothetical protein